MTTLNAWWLLIFAFVALNGVTWAVYRWDKHRARRGGRRISEHTLLMLAWFGGWPGALVAVYGHRQRHKAQKLWFTVPLWIGVVTWVVALALIVQRFS